LAISKNKTLGVNALQQCINSLLGAHQSSLKFCIGLSGGVDSIALLHLFKQLASQNTSIAVRALHINHQLQNQSGDWQHFCQLFCMENKIPFESVSVRVPLENSQGMEASARAARYRAFRQALRPDEIMVTAHHLDDHIETIFLKLFRGAGVKGGAGIESLRTFHNTILFRPLLSFSRESIINYAQANNLEWMEDPSNKHIDIDRNFLRHEILPRIESRWPGYRKTVNRFSKHLRESEMMLEEMARQDYSRIISHEGLLIDELKKLSILRQKLLVRYWLLTESKINIESSHLNEIFKLIDAREDANPVVKIDGYEVRRFKKYVKLLEQQPQMESDWCIKLDDLDFEQPIKISDSHTLFLRKAKGKGIKMGYLHGSKIQISPRKGGEKCHPVSRDKSQSLKKIFQEMEIPPWRRDEIPLLYIDESIAAVIGEFYCKPFAVLNSNEEGFVIELGKP